MPSRARTPRSERGAWRKTEIRPRRRPHCFMERGYHATGIDDVARRLGCTKGRILPSLCQQDRFSFFAVHREGMARLFRRPGGDPALAGRTPSKGLRRCCTRTRGPCSNTIPTRPSLRRACRCIASRRRPRTSARPWAALIAERDRFRGLVHGSAPAGDRARRGIRESDGSRSR